MNAGVRVSVKESTNAVLGLVPAELGGRLSPASTGLRSLYGALNTIPGYEVMNIIRKRSNPPGSRE